MFESRLRVSIEGSACIGVEGALAVDDAGSLSFEKISVGLCIVPAFRRMKVSGQRLISSVKNCC